ncbi:hypothetical protein BCR39DRAFT_560509 [Naematelia encephala]|uniref:ATP synthase subunit K, mitochondrial n=1 Tax=Naematelia encephala TaxID=71784 RepID=A0A1Y2AVZ5_9TREE|nr:hypothetical protein BCR39DRAFT_560509 [Naematelia encephala]
MSYTIAGRAIKNEYLALGTIFTTIGIAVAASGGDKAKKSGPVPVEEDANIVGSSKDEESFIRKYVADAEKEAKGAHH